MRRREGSLLFDQRPTDYRTRWGLLNEPSDTGSFRDLSNGCNLLARQERPGSVEVGQLHDRRTFESGGGRRGVLVILPILSDAGLGQLVAVVAILEGK